MGFFWSLRGLRKVDVTFDIGVCKGCRLGLGVGLEGVQRQLEERVGRRIRVQMSMSDRFYHSALACADVLDASKSSLLQRYGFSERQSFLCCLKRREGCVAARLASCL